RDRSQQGDHKRRILREKVTKTTQFIVKRFLVYLKPFYENKDTSMSNVGKLYESVIGVAVLMVLMFTKLFCKRK
ncbi:MAG: hypothetical protein IKI79_00910, partial [Erysipelotrichaceae bacterium]|nr:hypothetical protein [Erysipelotrichaceae bacterium]